MPSDPHIRPIVPGDADAWIRLRTAMWPDGASDHPQEIAAFFAGAPFSAGEGKSTFSDPLAVYVAESDGQCVAILELAMRTNLPEAPNEKVGYIEGLYIIPEFRGQRLTKLLLRTAQSWARQQQCTAFASDRAGRIILDPHYRA